MTPVTAWSLTASNSTPQSERIGPDGVMVRDRLTAEAGNGSNGVSTRLGLLFLDTTHAENHSPAERVSTLRGRERVKSQTGCKRQ
jgi:hypothetical protein